MQPWDLDKSGNAPGQYNILVANNLSANVHDLPSALDALYENTLEGGFIFLQVTVLPPVTLVLICLLYRKNACQSTISWKALNPVHVSLANYGPFIELILSSKGMSAGQHKAIILYCLSMHLFGMQICKESHLYLLTSLQLYMQGLRKCFSFVSDFVTG